MLYLIGRRKYLLKYNPYLLWLDCGSVEKQTVIETTSSDVQNRNHGDFSDKNTVIYGHNMNDGSMFASLAEYKDQKYYESFPTMVLYTPDGDFTIELFAGIVADGNYEFVRCEFQDDKDFMEYINTLKERSTFESNTIVKPGDRIVTLCTCSYESNNARYALFGRLTPV